MGVLDRPHRATVADVMTREVVSVRDDAPYRHMVRLLAERHVSALPVVDPAGAVVGIVSEADLLPSAESRPAHLLPVHRRPRRAGIAAAERVAHDVMSSPVTTARPDMLVAEAARLMLAHRIKRLPVVDATGTLVGIVSRIDLLRPALRSDEEIRVDIVDGVMRHWLWIDPATVEVRVEAGSVTLTGRLERRSDADLVAKLVAELDGVVTVDSRLEYERDDLHERFPPAEARIR